MFLNRRFGDYVLIKKLATGGMAEIFLARKDGVGTFEKVVAIKMIIAGHAHDQRYQRMFHNEAEISARFNHPNVVQLYDATRVGDTDFMVLEHMPGHTVADVTGASARAPSRALWLACASARRAKARAPRENA